MLNKIINSQEYQEIMSEQIKLTLSYLIKENIDFNLVLKSSEIKTKPITSKMLFTEEIILLKFSGFTFDLNSDYMYFKSYLEGIETSMEIYYNTISKILVDNKEILNNICVFSEEKKYLQELKKINSRNVFLLNKKNTNII